MKKITAIVLICSALSQGPVYAEQNNEINLYAAPYGSDIYGTGTKLRPFKTVEKINAEAKKLIKTGTGKDINVILRGGEYTLEESVSFNYLEKGKYEGKLTYKAYPGEKVSLLGASDEYEWENAGNGIYRTKVSSEVDVIYENGEMAIKARYPNRGEKRSDGYLIAAYDGTDSELNFKEGDFPEVSNQTDLQIYLWAGGESVVYALDNPGVAVDYSQNKITLNKTTTNNAKVKAGSRYYMQNALEFLDEPGEMYYDSLGGYVYYMPYDETKLKDVYIPQLNTGFSIEGISKYPVSNVSIEGIELKYFGTNKSNAGQTIYLKYGENINISDCYINNCGGDGIYLNYTDNSEILGNKIENVGGEGIEIKYSKHTDNRGNNLIKDNYIKTVGLYDAESSGITVTTTSSNLILNNTVTDSPRAAVNVGTGSCQLWNLVKAETVIDGVVVTRENAKAYLTCNDNIVRYNDLSDSMKETNDGGVIYTWGMGYDNDFSYNYIHDSVTDFSFTFGGIYIDDDCSKTTITNNFIKDIHSGEGEMRNVIIVKGQDNVVDNNFIIDCTPVYGIFRVDSQSGAGPVGNATYTNNISYNSGNVMYGFYSYQKNPSNPLNLKFKECSGNIFYNKGENFKVLARNNGGEMVSMANQSAWQTNYGHDVDSSFIQPKFADTYSNDYRLNDDTVAKNLGISGIDISGCGISDRYKFKSEGELDKVYIKGDGNADLTLDVNDTRELETVVKMSDGVVRSDAKITFFSSNSNVLMVAPDGEITAKSTGNATVTAVAQVGEKIVTDELYVVVR